MPETVASLQDVSFSYDRRDATLLKEVSATFYRSQVTALIGPNGSGKTTLLGLLSGRLRPTTGRVMVFGGEPSKYGRLPHVGVIADPLNAQQSTLPVDLSLQQLAGWLKALDGITSAEFRGGVERLHLSHLPSRPSIRRFSKGERQRVALLAALLRRPQLVLADEPLEGLDITTREAMAMTFQRLAKRDGAAIVWVSHHLDEALPVADRVLRIENSTVVDAPQQPVVLRLTAEGQPDVVHVTRYLQVLPSIVEKALRTQQSIRLEIRRERECQ